MEIGQAQHRDRQASLREEVLAKYSGTMESEIFMSEYWSFMEAQRISRDPYLGYLTKDELDNFLKKIRTKYGFKVDFLILSHKTPKSCLNALP